MMVIKLDRTPDLTELAVFCVLNPSAVFNSSILWTVASQALLSMGFLRQGYWSRLPFPPPGDLPDQEIEPMSPVSPALQEDSLPAEP